MACPSLHLCVATGDAVATTAQPTGGVRAWKLIARHMSGTSATACPSVKLCVAVGDARSVVLMNPGGHSMLKRTPGEGEVLACPSVHLCLAGSSDETGSALTTT